ncbi:MAG: filamentous hemagglutinin N-terminal domain-containing protein [Planctomycetota bacterium]
MNAKRTADRILPKFATATLLAAALTAPAAAKPQGATIKRGNVTIEQIGNEFRVTASDGSIVEYSAFDVASGELVNFLGRSGKSGDRILNRVTTLDRAQINGTIAGDMKVYLTVPGGITFGPGARVTLPGFVAVAGDMSDRDFIDGVDRFTNLNSSIEIEQGAEIGASDTLALVANRVVNAGDVFVEDGTLIVAVGDEVMFTSLDGHVIFKITGAGAASPNGSLAAIDNTATGEITADLGSVFMAVGDPLGSSLATANAAFAAANEQATTQMASGRIDNQGIIGSLGNVEITAYEVQGTGLIGGRNLEVTTENGIGSTNGPVNIVARNASFDNVGEGDININVTTFANVGIDFEDDGDGDGPAAPTDWGLGQTTLDRLSTLGNVNVTSTDGAITVAGLVEGNAINLLTLEDLDIQGTVQAPGEVFLSSLFGTVSTQAGAQVESFGGGVTITGQDLALDTSGDGSIEAASINILYLGEGVIGLGTSETGDFVISDAEFDQLASDEILIGGVADSGIVLGQITGDEVQRLTLTTLGGISEETVDFQNNLSGIVELAIIAGGDIGAVPPGSLSTSDRGTVDVAPTGDLSSLIDFDVETVDIFVNQPGTVNISDTAGDLTVRRIFTTSGDIRIESVGDLNLVDVTANSEVTANTATGNVGLGTVSASEGITIVASGGGISDIRTDTSTPNLTAGTNVFLAANSVGSEAAPITWDGSSASVRSNTASGFIQGSNGTLTVTSAGATTGIEGTTPPSTPQPPQTPDPVDPGQPIDPTTPTETGVTDIASDIPRGNGAAGDPAGDNNAPLWVIGDFLETVGWLAPHPELAEADRAWGAELADLVEVVLQQRGKRTAGLGDEQVSQAEVTELMTQGLQYKLDGVIETLEAYVDEQTGEPMARLTVVYQLEKNIAQQLRVVQKRRLRTVNDAEPVITEEDLEALLGLTAERIADRVVEETPAGMMGVRG